MFDTFFLAEKPSLAKEIAEARAEELGVRATKADGYWAVGNDAVSWLFGHMYEQAPPEFYDEAYKDWKRIELLPVIPPKWSLQVVKDKRDHIAKIAKLLKQAKRRVNAGDAGREGQLLVDEVFMENGCDPFDDSTLRLWCQSVARKDLLAALRAMEPNAVRRNLYNSAVCRQRADWLHGMNLTRLFTALARAEGADLLVSVGRVQTPTLKLIVDRCREIKSFRPVDHYLPAVTFRHENGSFKATWVIPEDAEGLDGEGRLVDKESAARVAAKVAGKTGAVEKYDTTAKSKAPPLPYSLSALQKDCSAKFGLSAQETLDVAQSLYETHKATTYPRSDSRYLPLAIYKDEAAGIVRNLTGVDVLAEAAGGANLSIKSDAWNDSKISDHHGIIPTSEFTAAKLGAMSDIERKVFMLVAKTFIAQFYPDQRWKALSAVVAVEGERFRTSGRVPVDAGWTRVFGAADVEEEEDADGGQTLPPMAVRDPVEATATEVQSKRTTPPPYFTDGTLVEAMTQIHKFVTDQEIRKKLKENDGLGTEATRANIIETLIRRKFIERRGSGKVKQIHATEIGCSVVDVLPDEVTSPGLTAVWEGYLERVNRGDLDPEQFMAAQVNTLTKRIETARSGDGVRIKGATVAPLEGHGEACPKCAQGKMITRVMGKGDQKGKKFLACNRYPECKHAQWPEDKVDPLPGDGKPCPDCGKPLKTRQVTSKKDGKKYKLLACTGYPECKHSEWPEEKVDPLPGHGKPCEKCGQGHMVTKQVTSKKDGKKYRLLSCDRRPECDAVEWPEPDVKPLPGHGKPCPQCGKPMKTREGVSKKTGKKYRMLSCSGYPACNHAEFPDADVEPLPGDGKACGKCGKPMKTKEITSKKDGQKYRFLSCTGYPACDGSEWPDDGKGGGKGGGGKGGKGSFQGKGGKGSFQGKGGKRS